MATEFGDGVTFYVCVSTLRSAEAIAALKALDFSVWIADASLQVSPGLHTLAVHKRYRHGTLTDEQQILHADTIQTVLSERAIPHRPLAVATASEEIKPSGQWWEVNPKRGQSRVQRSLGVKIFARNDDEHQRHLALVAQQYGVDVDDLATFIAGGWPGWRVFRSLPLRQRIAALVTDGRFVVGATAIIASGLAVMTVPEGINRWQVLMLVSVMALLGLLRFRAAHVAKVIAIGAPTLIAVSGGIAYLSSRHAYSEFFGEFGVSPDEVGFTYQTALARTGDVVAIAFLFAAVISGAWLLSVNFFTKRLFRGWPGVGHRAIVALQVVMTLLVSTAAVFMALDLFLGFTGFRSAQSLAERVKHGQVVRGTGLLSGVHIQPVNVTWVGENKGGVRLSPGLLKLGENGKHVVLYDRTAASTLHVPSVSVLVTTRVATADIDITQSRFVLRDVGDLRVGSTVQIKVSNGDSVRHNFSIPGYGLSIDLPALSFAEVEIAPAAAGRIDFFCRYHRAAGMEKWLQVGS